MIRILLLVIAILALIVPFYNRTDPELFGFPFFYWYQMLVVPIGSLLLYIVYLAEHRGADKEG
jgi:uncharacterized membrane protein